MTGADRSRRSRLDRHLAAILAGVIAAACAVKAEAEGAAMQEAAAIACAEMRNPALCRQVAGIRGVNLGNALEAPVEGTWGVMLNEYDFRIIARGGFNTVRVPIRWNAHAQAAPPYSIDREFFARIDWVLQQAAANGLRVILNVHHYEEIFGDPAGHRERFLALWDQIAKRYAEQDADRVWFEILNEPHDGLQGAAWNRLLGESLAVVRRTNPRRPVLVGGDNWNAYDSLPGLEIPEDDNLVLTFHYYLPFPFTHQGAEWVAGAERWLGTTWDATPAQSAEIGRHFDTAARAARERSLPVVVGEFGAYSRAPMDSRGRWTRSVVEHAEARGFGWIYWEFRAGFGVFDGSQGGWVEPLYRAMLPGGG